MGTLQEAPCTASQLSLHPAFAPEKFSPLPDDTPSPLDLTSLVKTLNNRDTNIKRRRARIDAIVDEDFTLLADLYQKLAQ